MLGCDRMYVPNSQAWKACVNQCIANFAAGSAQCYADYEWCAEGCDDGRDDDEPPENCPIVIDLGRGRLQFTSPSDGVLFDIDGDSRSVAGIFPSH